jgi:hypothetical protein
VHHAKDPFLRDPPSTPRKYTRLELLALTKKAKVPAASTKEWGEAVKIKKIKGKRVRGGVHHMAPAPVSMEWVARNTYGLLDLDVVLPTSELSCRANYFEFESEETGKHMLALRFTKSMVGHTGPIGWNIGGGLQVALTGGTSEITGEVRNVRYDIVTLSHEQAEQGCYKMGLPATGWETLRVYNRDPHVTIDFSDKSLITP